MTPDQIREQFAAFVGHDKFVLFLTSFNRRARKQGHLTYSQEHVWSRFIDAHPEYANLGFNDFVPVFRYCHVHMKPLVDRDVPIMKHIDEVDFAPEYEKVWAERFPYAQKFMTNSPAFDGLTHLTVDHCNECWQEMERYAAGQDA